MLVQDFFTNLANCELQNLSVAAGGAIAPSAYPRFFKHTNDALLQLYSKFLLKENDFILQLYEHITNYRLIPEYSVNYTPLGTADNRPIRYIVDLPHEKFKDELIKVTQVFDHMGREIQLNDENEPFSVFTPQVKMLQVPNPMTGVYLNVKYQQRHPVLKGELSEYIELPDVLETALSSYVAYRVFSQMNSQDGVARSQDYQKLFDSTCDDVAVSEMFNLSISQTNARFEKGGWR
jgi:hypothetical protein